MKKTMVFAVLVVLMVPGLAAAQEKEKSPFQIYSAEQTPANFLNAYNAYEAQRRDTANYGATAMLAWLNYYELERNLEVLKTNAASLSNMNKFQYANILLELGKYDEAIPLYVELNEKNPKWSCPWRHKGTAYWKKGDLDEAVTALEKSIETRKTHYDAYVVLAHVYNDKKDYRKALSTLDEGLGYYGKDSEDPDKEMAPLDVQFLRLELLKKVGDKKEYEAQYEKLRTLAPDDERLRK